MLFPASYVVSYYCIFFCFRYLVCCVDSLLFSLAYSQVTPFVVTKKTVFKWQEEMWQKMREVFNKNYKDKFLAAGTCAFDGLFLLLYFVFYCSFSGMCLCG
jgi:hypothetical protein